MIAGWSGAMLLAVGVGLAPARGAAQPPLGTAIERVELPTLAGPPAPLLGKAGLVSVILFFRTDQENSRTTLKMMADCERELREKPLHWAAVVSSHAPPDEVRALVAETRLEMPVLLDRDDALYDVLQVKLHPVVVLADTAGKLAAYEPFRKVNYCAEVKAWMRRLLGEITQAELESTLHPADSTYGGDKARADIELRMARRHLDGQSWEKAIAAGRRALAHDPQRAAAHALVARALAGQGDCAGAAAELSEALKLDPKDPDALAGAPECVGK